MASSDRQKLRICLSLSLLGLIDRHPVRGDRLEGFLAFAGQAERRGFPFPADDVASQGSGKLRFAGVRLPGKDGDLSALLRFVTLGDSLDLNRNGVNRVLVIAGIGFDLGLLNLGGHVEDLAPDDMGGLSLRFLLTLRSLGA